MPRCPQYHLPAFHHTGPATLPAEALLQKDPGAGSSFTGKRTVFLNDDYVSLNALSYF